MRPVPPGELVAQEGGDLNKKSAGDVISGLLHPAPFLALLVGDLGAPPGGKLVLIILLVLEPLLQRDACTPPFGERSLLFPGTSEPFIERNSCASSCGECPVFVPGAPEPLLDWYGSALHACAGSA